LKSVQNKLANENVNGAPEKCLANEKTKRSRCISKIETIENSLAGLK
jgi:hypothetical protein